MAQGKFSSPRPHREEEREIEQAFRQITGQAPPQQKADVSSDYTMPLPKTPPVNVPAEDFFDIIPEDSDFSYEEPVVYPEAEPDFLDKLMDFFSKNKQMILVGLCSAALFLILAVVGVLLFSGRDANDGMILDNVYIGTVNVADVTKEELSEMMVGRKVQLSVQKTPSKPGDTILHVENMTVAGSHQKKAVDNVSFDVRAGEIVCIAGIDGNGQSELVYGISGLEPVTGGSVRFCGNDITHAPIRKRSLMGMSHIPEDRHKHGLVLDYTLEDNMILQRYFDPEFTDKFGFLRRKNIRAFAERLIEQYDVRSGQGPITVSRAMSGGNQQKAIIAREIDKDPQLLIAVQPTRGLDVGAIEYIHKQIVAQRDAGKAVLLVSLELDEVMTVSDRILVMYEGEIVGQLNPKTTTQEEMGLYMAGAKRDEVTE